MIGLGLYDLTDISLKGLDAIRKSNLVYLEHYTAILHTGKAQLEQFFGKKIVLANRNCVETSGDKIVEKAKSEDVAFLVVGDPFGATTHIDLYLRAIKQDVKVHIIHNASILSAVGAVGLELYKYGKTTSIVFDDDNWLPNTPYEVIKNNNLLNLHTLCLLDIKVAEASKEDLLKGTHTPKPPRFMTVSQAITVLNKLEEKNKQKIITEDTLMIAVARLGSDDQIIKAASAKELLSTDFGKPMHSLIIPAQNLHFMEEEIIAVWKQK